MFFQGIATGVLLFAGQEKDIEIFLFVCFRVDDVLQNQLAIF